MTKPTASPIVSALQRVLVAHSAAVYGYSAIGVHLRDAHQVQVARSYQDAHTDSRDLVAAAIVALGGEPDGGGPTYSSTKPVIDVTSAQTWARDLESDAAAAYRFLLVASAADPGAGRRNRSTGAEGLTTAATHGAYWQRLLTPRRPTVPFPGTDAPL